MSDQEKRYKERYDLEIPFTARWLDGSGRTRETDGTTKNMGPLGAFIVCDSPIVESCTLDLHFHIPVALGGTILSRISASGKVVRDVRGVQHVAGYGHGVMFNRLSFTKLQEP